MEHSISQIEDFSDFSENGELENQLRQKVKSQAKRLRCLENYSALCEQRIQELSPQHSFPVKQQHLGTGSSLETELQKARQEIQKLRKLHKSSGEDKITAELEEAKQDKLDLEESLRAEMLMNEQQSIYIQVLKQTLEAKMDSLGLSGNPVDHFVDFVQSRNQLEGSKRLSNKLKSQEAYIEELTQKIKSLHSENEELKKEKEENETYMKEAAETIENAEEEVQKLEQEKENLLEYVDQHDQMETSLKEELKQTSQKLESTQISLKVLKDKHSCCEATIQDLQNQVNSQDSQINELQNAYEETEVKLEQKHNTVIQLEEDISQLSAKTQNTHFNHAALSETLKETQTELENLQLKTEELTKELETYKEKCQAKQDLIQELQQEKENTLSVFALKEQNKQETELSKKLVELTKERDELKDCLTKKEEELAQVSQNNDSLLNELNKLQSSFFSDQVLNDENSELRKQVQELNKTISEKTCEECQQLKEEAQLLKDKYEQERTEKFEYSDKIKAVYSKLEDYKASTKDLTEFKQNSRHEIFSLKHLVLEFLEHEELQSFKSYFFKYSKKEDIHLEDLHAFIKTVAENLIPLLTKIQSLKKQTTQNQTQKENLETQLKETTEQLQNTQAKNKKLTQEVKDFSGDLEHSKQTNDQKVLALQKQITSLREQIQKLNEENLELSEKLKATSNQTLKWKYTAQTDTFTIKSLEARLNLVAKEKHELENLLTRVQSFVYHSNIQKLIFEFLRVRGDLELFEREKLRIQNQQMRSSDTSSEEYLQLEEQLEQCEYQIELVQSKMEALDDEIQEIEETERKRTYEYYAEKKPSSENVS